MTDDFEDVIDVLKRWEVPPPDDNKTAQLIELLQPELPEDRRRWFDPLMESMPVLLLYAQLKVIQQEIWLISAFMMLLGTVLTLPALPVLPLALIAPLVAAVGIAWVYGPGSDPALEIELASPVSPRMVMLARLTLVFGFDCLLGLAGSIILSVFNAELLLWQVVIAWFAPMALLSSLAFLLTVLFRDSNINIAISGILWLMHSLRLFPSNPLVFLDHLPDLTLPQTFLLAGLLVMLALWLIGFDERWLQDR